MDTKKRCRPLAASASMLLVTVMVVGMLALLPVQTTDAADALGWRGSTDFAPPITTDQVSADGHRASTQPLESAFRDDFDSPALDPAWQVVEFTGARVYGYTSPANHISLAANPGYLRYYVDAMTYVWGFLNNYQVYVPYYNYDFGLELHRPFSGEHWRFETKADYYLPYTNGRGLNVHIYFGDGGANTFVFQVQRYRDVGASSNSVGIGLLEKFGPTLDELTTLESYGIYEDTYGPPQSTYFYRLERNGSILTASWSPNGVTWTQAWSRDMGTALDGLAQRVTITGLSWFNPVDSYADYDYVSLTDESPTFSISGRVMDGGDQGIPDVTISATGGYSTTTDASGAYTLTEAPASTYAVTPTLEGYSFDPVTRSVEVPPDATGQDFLGTLLTYSISGQVTDASDHPIAGATISATGGYSTTTGATGAYTLTNLLPGNYTLTPTLDGYSFDPVTRSVDAPPDATGQDFLGTLLTYSISGQVTDASDHPIAGVTISATGGYSTTTGATGAYTLTNLLPGSYTLTPTLDGYSFDPVTRSVDAPPDATGLDFLGTLLTYSISGQVTDASGDPIAGVTISATGGYSTTTDATGAYILTNLLPGSYTLTLTLDGYNFDPVTRSVDVPPDATGQDFTGDPVRFRVYLPLVLRNQ